MIDLPLSFPTGPCGPPIPARQHSTRSAVGSAAGTRSQARAGQPRRIDLISDEEFHRIYQAHSRPLWSFLYRVCRDATVADDLLQEVFCRYLEAPASSRDEVGLRSYLLKIGSNLAIDRGRRLAREKGKLSAEQPQARDRVASGLGLDLARLYAELNPRERALLWLAYVEEQDHATIARILGLSRASVRVLLFRARRHLARILRREGLDERDLP